MAETATKLPVRTEEKRVDRPGVPAEWRPFESLKRQIDQLCGDSTLPLGATHSAARRLRPSRLAGRAGLGEGAASTSLIRAEPTRSPLSCPGWTSITSTSSSPTVRPLIKGEKTASKSKPLLDVSAHRQRHVEAVKGGAPSAVYDHVLFGQAHRTLKGALTAIRLGRLDARQPHRFAAVWARRLPQ